MELCHLQQHDGREIIIQMKSERERQILYCITYMCNLQYDTNKLTYQVETDLQTWWLQGRNGLGVWDWQMQTITYRMDKPKGLTV